MSVAENGETFHVSLSSVSSVRTLRSLAASVMRCDLISRIVILSISSPGEMGTSSSAMGASTRGECADYSRHSFIVAFQIAVTAARVSRNSSSDTTLLAASSERWCMRWR